MNPIQSQILSTVLSLPTVNHLTPTQLKSFIESLTHDSLGSALAHSGLTQSEQQQVMSRVQAQLTNALGAQGLQKDKAAHDAGGGNKSWLEAIAEAMGQALGEMAQKLVDESSSLQSEAGNADGSSAQQFQATMAKFQADSNLFSILSNAFATAIKQIGEGMTTMAAKQ